MNLFYWQGKLHKITCQRSLFNLLSRLSVGHLGLHGAFAQQVVAINVARKKSVAVKFLLAGGHQGKECEEL